jgi:hypothetical protein
LTFCVYLKAKATNKSKNRRNSKKRNRIDENENYLYLNGHYYNLGKKMPRSEAEKIIFKFDNGSRIKLAKEIREET